MPNPQGPHTKFRDPKQHGFKPQHHNMGPLHEKPDDPLDICHETLRTTIESHGFIFETQCGQYRKDH